MTLLIVITMVSAIIIAVKVQQAKKGEKKVDYPQQDLVFPVQSGSSNPEPIDHNPIDSEKPVYELKVAEDVTYEQSSKDHAKVEEIKVQLDTKVANKKASTAKKEVKPQDKKETKTKTKPSTNKTKNKNAK